MRLRPTAFVISTALLIAGIIALAWETSSLEGMLFFMPFALGPLAVNSAISYGCHSRLSQRLMITAALLYTAWLTWTWIEIFVLHPDPQSPIALLFAGVISLPVMLPLWIVAWITRHAPTAKDPAANE